MNDIFKNNMYSVKFTRFIHDGTPLAKQGVVFAMDGKENYLTNVLDFIYETIKSDKKHLYDWEIDCSLVDVGNIYIMCRECFYDDNGKLINFGEWASAEMILCLNNNDFGDAIMNNYGINCVG